MELLKLSNKHLQMVARYKEHHNGEIPKWHHGMITVSLDAANEIEKRLKEAESRPQLTESQLRFIDLNTPMDI